MKKSLIALVYITILVLSGCLTAEQAQNETLREKVANATSFQPGPNPPRGCGNGILEVGEQCEVNTACGAGQSCVGCLCTTPAPGGSGSGGGAGPAGSPLVDETLAKLEALGVEYDQVVADLIDTLSRLEQGFSPKDDDIQLVEQHLGKPILESPEDLEELMRRIRADIIEQDECYVIGGVGTRGCAEPACVLGDTAVRIEICDTRAGAKAEKENYLARIGRCVGQINSCITTERCVNDQGVYCRGEPCQFTSDCPNSFCEDGITRAPRCSSTTPVGTTLEQNYCMHSPRRSC